MFVLTSQPTAANHFLAELRDTHIQRDSMRFRYNLERIGEILGYELSKTLRYNNTNIQTPLALKQTALLADGIVLAAILRAGLPLFNGLHRVFDRAECAFIGAYRAPHVGIEDLTIETEYLATPNLDNKVLIIADPMLATGKSLVKSFNSFEFRGQPRAVHIVAAIATEQGAAYVQEQIPQAHLWVGDLDPELNSKAYIVPGLGDAGDLAFGSKM